MKLENYISDLLYRYDCVIVPNFGGFIANTKSAQLKNAIFTPPFKQISFNSLLTENDGLLANYIAQTDKMPYKTAMNFISFEVEEWINKLLKEDLELEGIGTLYSANDSIHFEPNNKINYLTESFGLDAVIANQLENQKQDVFEEDTSLKIVDKIETAPVLTLPKTQKKKNHLLKYAAIFLLGTATIGVSTKMYQEKQNKAAHLANSIQQQDIRTNKIQQATFVIDTPLPTIKVKTSILPKNYFIIAGAFRNENNAIKKVNELKSKGFNAQIVGKNKYNLTQVAFASFSDLEKANSALLNIKSTVLKDAWLLVKE